MSILDTGMLVILKASTYLDLASENASFLSPSLRAR